MSSPPARAIPLYTVLTGNSGAVWTVGEQVGSGGTAQVFAVSRADGTAAVAKVLSGHRFPIDDEARQRFDREARHLRAVEHPNVVRVLDLAAYGEEPVLILERADKSLYMVLRELDGPIPVWLTTAWFRAALAGVAAMHEVGLVHRDLSPKNILFDARGRLLIADFGTVRHLHDGTITTDRSALGSLIYVSRQQFEQAHTATFADDVFSLGQIAYELLTGSRPVGNAPSVGRAREDIPAPLAELIEAMRSDDSNDRPATGREALERLLALITSSRDDAMPAIESSLHTLWRERQLETLAGLRGTIDDECLPQLEEVVTSIGPVRLGVSQFRALEPQRAHEEVALDRSGSRGGFLYPYGVLVLLGSGSARFHVGTLEGGGFTWTNANLHNRLNGKAMQVESEPVQSVGQAHEFAALVVLHQLEAPEFWRAFDTPSFLEGTPCADCGRPLGLRVYREDLDVNSYVRHPSVHRSALCPEEEGSEPLRCCICGQQFSRHADRDEYGPYDAVGCGCGGFAFQVDYDERPWSWSRPMKPADIAACLERQVRAFDGVPPWDI